MKFKYVGDDDCFCIELLAYKLVPKGSYLKNGQIIDVPNNLANVVTAMQISGQFQEVKDNKKSNKKEDKE